MNFYLGTHMPNWLGTVDVPLFVQHSRLLGGKRPRVTLPRARAPWALDSGGFTMLDKPPHRWTITPESYVAAVRRYVEEIGQLDWATPMDWMCEPWIIEKTGLSVVEHQRRTIENVLLLRDLAPDVPFVPVLQGWQIGDYLRHVEDYTAAGIDLAVEPVVGVGSVCRRQHTGEIAHVLGSIAATGLRLHGFGLKTEGLATAAHSLASADSLSWSSRGQHVHPAWCDPSECTNCARGWSAPSSEHCGSTTHRGEGNCPIFALAWRDRVLAAASGPKQLAFGEAS